MAARRLWDVAHDWESGAEMLDPGRGSGPGPTSQPIHAGVADRELAALLFKTDLYLRGKHTALTCT